MFMLRMIGSNSGDFVCTQVLHNLWKLFLYKKYTLKHESKKSLADPELYPTNYQITESEDEKSKFNRKNKISAITKLFKDQRKSSRLVPTKQKELRAKPLASIRRKSEFPRQEPHEDNTLTYTELKRKSRAKLGNRSKTQSEHT